jgi:hypothetical protein
LLCDDFINDLVFNVINHSDFFFVMTVESVVVLNNLSILHIYSRILIVHVIGFRLILRSVIPNKIRTEVIFIKELCVHTDCQHIHQHIGFLFHLNEIAVANSY